MILRIVCLTIFLGIGQTILFSQPYSRIYLEDLHQKDIYKLQQLGIALDCGSHIAHPKSGDGAMNMKLEVSQQEIAWIQDAGFSFTILVEDLESYYAQRAMRNLPLAREDLERQKLQSQTSTRNTGQYLGCLEEYYPVPQHFELGDMAGFFTYQEILEILDSMQTMFPDLISFKTPIHDSLTTIEGRPVYYVKISDQPAIDENEPEVLYTGLHHAREPGSAMNLIFYMWYLLENYALDSDIQNLVDNRELYFVPVVNPDGYVFNEMTNPNGGGLWRKNMRENLDGSLGVDLNRNYSFKWGLDNIGSSPNGNSSTYRGTAPFSEPETRMMKEFAESHSFQTSFHNHSYGNLLLSPWGYTDIVHAEDDLYNTWSNHMTWFNRYEFGQDILYLVNGEATDWFYGEEMTKAKVYSYVPEIGASQESGFWPISTYILPQCKRQMRMSLLLAYYAGRYALFHDLTPRSLDGLSDSLIFGIERLGLEEGDMTLSLTPISSGLTFPQPVQTISNLDRLENRKIAVAYSLDSRIWPGEDIVYEIRLNNGRFDIYTETIMKTFRMPEIIADDPDVAGMSNWSSSSIWGIGSNKAFSGSQSITDSPSGNYASGTSYLHLKDTLDVSKYTELYAQYYANWTFDRQRDRVYLESSSNLPFYEAECGTYTRNTSTTTANKGMLGTQAGWVLENHDLSDLAGEAEVSLRLVMNADNINHADGVYIDDFKVYGKVDCNTINSAAATIVNPTSGPNMSDGMIDVIMIGSSAPYRFRWSTTDTTEDITGLSAGTYSLAFVDKYGCIDSVSALVPDNPVLGLNTIPGMSLSVYPVPVHDVLKLELEGVSLLTEWEISLRSVYGQELYQQMVTTSSDRLLHQIPVGNLSRGVYFLTIEGKEGAIVRKVMIE